MKNNDSKEWNNFVDRTMCQITKGTLDSVDQLYANCGKHDFRILAKFLVKEIAKLQKENALLRQSLPE